mgnify:CR=1 FL=1
MPAQAGIQTDGSSSTTASARLCVPHAAKAEPTHATSILDARLRGHDGGVWGFFTATY